ncbi:MAG: hypothetical protein A2Y97_08130 [Nitrospirae bacterium RBG_13_39_12]|nr:MAG: hypothetical protein A2Y97_08130 [Nitrospirae bacterium RBG_13_39_12]
MKQLTQKLKDGKMEVLEVPAPIVEKGMVLVKNHFSLISAGTEGSTVSAARKSLIGKAKDSPLNFRRSPYGTLWLWACFLVSHRIL